MLTVRSTINIASQTVPPIIPVVQGDTGRAILFTLADFTIPAGATATYYVQKPSGEAVYNNATIDGNNVLVELTAQSIIEKGDNYGQVRITVGEEVVTSFDFILLVKEFRGIDAVQSLTEMNIFDKAVEQASEAIDEVKTDALEAIDDAKDEAIEEVTSNFDLKLDASSTKGVQNQVITQAINTVNNAIGDLSGETVTPTATNNYGVGGNVGQVIETWATTEYWHGIYTVSAGNTYGITTVSDFPQQIVVWFTNSSNVILEIHKAFATDHVEMVCTAPTGATKLFVMSYGYDAYHGTVQKVEPLSETVSNLKEDKADIDGYYQDMTVGDAEQLVASQYVEDSVPYNFRTTGGSADVGNREYVDDIVGGSIVWNQLVNSSITSLSNNGVTFTHNNGKWDISGTATGRVQTTVIFDRFNTIAGHKYFMGISKDIAPFRIRENNGSLQQTATSKVLACTEGKLTYFNFDSTTDISGTSVDIKDVDITITDLTQMFGSTIADYIYSLEQSTAGAGVAWFKKLFPNMDAEYSYHEDSFDEESPLITKKLRDYQPGILLSIEGLASHNTVGFNQWDEEWENGLIGIANGQNINGTGIRSKNFCKCVPNTTYHFESPYNYTRYVFWYDSDQNYIGNSTVGVDGDIISDSNARYFRIRVDTITTYNNDICINLSWSGWRNGEYEAYQKHSYPLDDSLTLRGIPKLDAQNNLFYDGDEYLPDGTVKRRYGVVDLGTLEWHAISGYAGYFKAVFTEVVNINNGVVANALCPKYVTVKGNDLASKDKAIAVGMNNAYEIQIGDSAYSTASASDFRNALAGVMLLYKKRLFTTETAEPYQHVQICDDFGTEEYVSTSIVPVGHNTRYPANLRDKLQHLPDLADDDGYYMIGQSNKQMHLELFRIPKAPTSPDGTYVLKATVSGGTPTYTWEART